MNKIKNEFPNETLKTIWNRRSIRLFTDQLVSEEDIKTILDAANQAPSAHNQQSWRFIVLEGSMKNQFANMVGQKAGDYPRPSSVLLRMAARSIASAPVVIAVVNTGKMIQHGTELFAVNKETAHDFFRVMEIQSSAAAVENLLLAATSLGLAAVWLGILILIKDEALKFLGEPKGEFMAVVPVGYCEKSVLGPHKKSLEMIVKHLK